MERKPQPKLQRRRYWRITSFFTYALLSLLFWEVLLSHLPGRSLIKGRVPARRRQLAKRFRTLAVEMGGVMIKLGQFLSARADVLPPEVTAELGGLQDEVPPHPFPPIKETIEGELGKPLQEAFSKFIEVPQAGASLGQTYYATLPGGEAVILKVQRPKIEEIVATDLAALQWVAGWLKRYPPLARRVDLDALLEEFSRTLYEELDYVAEAKNAERFAANFAQRPYVNVPHPHWSHTTKRVLTLDQVGGIKVNDREALIEAGIDPRLVAERIFETYAQQILFDGFFHADPHPGNLFVEPSENTGQKDFRIAFIDFGMVGRITPANREAIKRAAISLTARDARALVRCARDLGFLLPSADVRPIERAASSIIDRYWGMSMGELVAIDHAEVAQLLLEMREIIYEFPFQVPKDFIFLGRAAGIVSGLCTNLDPEFNPFHSLEPFVKELLVEEGGREPLQMAVKELSSMAALFWRLPREAEEALLTMTRGELEMRISQLQDLDGVVGRLERGMRGLTWGIIFATLLLGGVLLLISGQIWPSRILLGLATLIGLGLLIQR